MAAKSLPLPHAVTAVESTQRTFGDIGPVLVHDVKGPLSAVSLNLDFVLEQLPPDASFDPVRGALSECRHASDRIFRAIANLLDVARFEEGRLMPRVSAVVLSELFLRVAASYEAELTQRHIDLRIDATGDLPSVDADVDLLSRILHSLVDNALRNAKDQGSLVLSAHVANDAIEIAIKNDGPPIPPSARNRLFARAVGTETEGAGLNRGLGLYFCRLALGELGASIALSDDEPGFPATFVIQYPIPARSVR